MPKLNVHLGLPDVKLNPNRAKRLHWATKGALVRKLREESMWASRAATFAAGFKPLVLTKCVVQAHWKMPNKARSADPDNLAAMLKPVWDGFQDSKLLADDKELTHLPVTQEVDPGYAGLYITIEWENEDAGPAQVRH